MTLPDLPAPRKPPSRWWLYGPYLALLLAMVVWSGAWFWIRGQVAAQLEALDGHASPGGPNLAWDRATISGYPFRIDVVLDAPRASEPSGWGVSAPQLRAEAEAYDLGHWVAYAPRGVVLTRPGAGGVAIAGQAVRASLALEAPGQARFAFEALNVAFTPPPGARPFPLLSAQHLDFHTRPAGPDQIEFLLQLQGAKPAPSTVLGRVAGAATVSSAWHGTLSKASALGGHDWPDAARAWSAAGGSITVIGADLDAGPVSLQANSGELAVGADGRLRGNLSLALARVPASLSAFGHAGALDPTLAASSAQIAGSRAATDPAAKLDLTFQAGVAALGPLQIGPSPRVF